MGLSEAGVKYSIDRVEVTDACLTGRAGLALISKYLKAVGVEKMLTGVFSFLKKSSKGTALASIFHQLMCFFGSSVKSVGKSSSHSLPGQSGNLGKDQKLNLNR